MRMTCFLSLLIFICAQYGCMSTRWIKNEEIHKLNGAQGLGFANTHLYDRPTGIRRTRKLLNGDQGQIVEVVGSFDVVLVRKDGTSTLVTSPVSVFQKKEQLYIRGSNQAKTPVNLQQVKKLGVRQPDPVATSILVGCISVGLVLAAGGAILAIGFSSSPE